MTPAASPSTSPPATRMGADERRLLVLDAATRAFAHGGYHGTSTDAVAREAGVSQPYVVRIFGTKLELFLEVFGRATDRIREAFEDVLAAGPFDPEDDADWERLGLAYTELVVDRDLLQVMMHAFSASGIEEIGAASRHCMGAIYATLTSTGCTDERARDFVAHGMLLNVMISMRAPEHLAGPGAGADASDPETRALAQLAACAFGEDKASILRTPPAQGRI